jgi:hypothetical protein
MNLSLPRYPVAGFQWIYFAHRKSAQIKIGEFRLASLCVVMGTGHPRANFCPPAPVPAETRTRAHGRGFPGVLFTGFTYYSNITLETYLIKHNLYIAMVKK